MRSCLISIFAFLFLLSPAHAQAPGLPQWNIRFSDSAITFRAKEMGKEIKGSVGKYTYDIRFDPDHPETGSADVTIDVSSILTGDKDRDKNLPTEEWFDTKKFPSIRFAATSFKAKEAQGGLRAYDALGNLTIKGISVPATLSFTLDLKAMDTVEKGLKSAHVKGHLDLDRSKFSLGSGEWADTSVIANNVTVEIDLMAFAKY